MAAIANPNVDSSLWFYSFSILFTDLENVPLSADLPPSMVEKLKENRGWFLNTGTQFKTPSNTSQEALNSQQVTVGSHNLNIKPHYKDLALKLSSTLCLDEIQSYILVQRFLDKNAHSVDGVQGFFLERLVWASLVHANAPKSPEKTMEDIENKGKAIANPRARHPSERITYKNRLETLLVVSTLVATVTFAANFTLPGGYNSGSGPDSDQHSSSDGKMMIVGMATLAHKPAFKVFAFSNTVAMFSSILAAVMLIWANLDDHRLSSLSLRLALPFLGTALTMMSVAFIAGLYVAWHVVCPVLSLALLILASLFLALILAFLIPLCSTSSPIKFKFLRFLLCPIFYLLLRACDH